MGSARLPGKSMMDLAGKPLVQHVLERSLMAKRLDSVVLATTSDPRDRILCAVARDLGVESFVGSEDDLIDRYYHAGRATAADIVVRIPADNPLIHGTEVDRIVEYFLERSIDFASNLQPRWGNGYPDGIGAEVFAFGTLERLHRQVREPKHREHVTTYFVEHPAEFTMGSCQCPPEFSRPEIKLDVNTLRDLEYVRRLLEDTRQAPQPIRMADIIRWYDEVGRVIPRD